MRWADVQFGLVFVTLQFWWAAVLWYQRGMRLLALGEYRAAWVGLAFLADRFMRVAAEWDALEPIVPGAFLVPSLQAWHASIHERAAPRDD